MRATLYVAQHGTRAEPVRRHEVATALSVPANYLSKVLHVLARRGVLGSRRGPHGGFYVKPSLASLRLHRIVDPFDDVALRRTCLLGRPQCSDANPCPAHHRWKEISERVAAFFRDTTVADLLGDEAKREAMLGRAR